MDTIKKSSFTLLEMVITIVVSSVLVLALAYQFVAIARFKAALENKAESSRETYIILNHVTHVLRFAKAASAPTFSSNTLTADIEGGHISLVPLTTVPPVPPNFITCYYRRDPNTNCLYFKVGAGAEQEISKYVTYFDASVTGTSQDREITLKFAFSRGDIVTPVQTKIRVLGQ